MAFRCQVLILPSGGTESRLQWYEGDGPGQLAYEQSSWEQAALERLSWAASEDLQGSDGEPHEYNVVLCLLGNPGGSDEGWDAAGLGRALENALAYCWGAPIYVVMSREIEGSILLDQREALGTWLEILVEKRIKGLLQVPYDPVAGVLPAPGVLLEACEHSRRQRQPLLQKLPAYGVWGCTTADALSSVHRLLRPFSALPGGPRDADHWLIVVEHEGEAQVNLVVARLKEFPEGAHQVVTVGAEPTDDLRAICAEAGLHAPLYLRSDLELWFLLLQLNARRQSEHGRHGLQHRRVEGAPSPTIVRLTRQSRAVLVSNAFSPTVDKSDQALWAAGDVGTLIQAMPPGTSYEVEVRATFERLLPRIRRLPQSVVWVHMGHGLGARGLEDADRAAVSAEAWVELFAGWGGSMSLALLLCCTSAATAASLVQAGAAVAIAFEGRVLSRRARLLAGPVLHAAFEHHCDQGRILETFDGAARTLKAIEAKDNAEHSLPIAFYQR